MSHTTTRPRHIMLSIILGIIDSEKHKGNNRQKSLDQENNRLASNPSLRENIIITCGTLFRACACIENKCLNI